MSRNFQTSKRASQIQHKTQVSQDNNFLADPTRHPRPRDGIVGEVHRSLLQPLPRCFSIDAKIGSTIKIWIAVCTTYIYIHDIVYSIKVYSHMYISILIYVCVTSVYSVYMLIEYVMLHTNLHVKMWALHKVRVSVDSQSW